MRKHKNKKGSAIAFGAALALVLVVLGLGFLAFSMYMGAQNETKNAVDAGALNLGKQVLDQISVNISGDPEQAFFRDVTTNLDGIVSLRNINRVWGKALFVAINSDAAGAQYQGTDASSSVQSAFDGASAISDALATKLLDASLLTQYFTDYADRNSVRMIGSNAAVKVMAGAGWQTSLMDRNDESNLQLKDNLPVGYTLNKSYSTPCTRTVLPQGAAGMNFLQGYQPLTVAGKTFWQVPYQYDEKPHLVSKTPFDANKQPPNTLPASWPKAVPNAFSVQGEAAKVGSVSEQATSWVQTNPRQIFPLQFPNGFVRIILKQNTIQWNIDGLPMDSSTYPSQMDSDEYSGDGIPYPFPPICAAGSGDCNCGNEYGPLPNLYIAIVGLPPDTNGDFMQNLLQRSREMLPDATMGDLTAALNLCFLSSDDSDQTFYLYPVAGKLVATPDSATVVPVGCDKSQGPEGNSQSMQTDIGPPDVPNYNLETWSCDTVTTPDIPMFSTLTITRSWKPGTGYQGGCLGELTVHHTTDAMVSVLPCSCP